MVKKISEIGKILIYVSCVLLGFVVGNIYYFKRYAKMILEVLDNLKFTKKINNEDYEYYKNKFLKQKDTMNNIIGFIKRNNNKEKNENE